MTLIKNIILLMILAASNIALAQTIIVKNETPDSIKLEKKRRVWGILEAEISSNTFSRQIFCFEKPIFGHFSLQGGIGFTHRPFLGTRSVPDLKVIYKQGHFATIGINYYIMNNAPRGLYIGASYSNFQYLYSKEVSGYFSSTHYKRKSYNIICNQANIRFGYQAFTGRVAVDYFIGGGFRNVDSKLVTTTPDNSLDTTLTDYFKKTGEMGIRIGFAF